MASSFITWAAPFMTCEIFSREVRSWMPILVTPMGQGLLPASQQTTLVHDGKAMRRVAVQYKGISARNVPCLPSWPGAVACRKQS